MTTPVTVAVTNYNGAAYIDDCLDAVAALRGQVDDVIVVDNASTDDSVERITRHAARLIRLDRNDGPCPARNRALAEAATRWVLQIDSDVIVQPDTLERLLPHADEPGVVAVQPRAVLAGDPDTIHYDGGWMHYVGVMCLDNLLAPSAGVTTEAGDVDAVISMALLLDRSAVLETGGYDDAYFILFEDHDLSYRLRARGHRLRREPNAVVLHREGTAGISYRPGAARYPERRAYLHARNRTYLVMKNYSLAALVATFPGRLAYGITWFLFACSRGVAGAYLKGRWDALRLLPRALRHRSDLPNRRAVGDRDLLGSPDLTFAPHVRRGARDARLQAVLNGILRAWWGVARRFVPASRPRG